MGIFVCLFIPIIVLSALFFPGNGVNQPFFIMTVAGGGASTYSVLLLLLLLLHSCSYYCHYLLQPQSITRILTKGLLWSSHQPSLGHYH